MLLQGLFIRDLIFFWRGIEDATKYMAEDNMMITISVGSHLPLVIGVVWGMKLGNADSIIAVYFGAVTAAPAQSMRR